MLNLLSSITPPRNRRVAPVLAGGGTSALAVAASALAVGSWVQLTTTGISALLSSGNGGGIGGNNIPYTNQMVWNPVTNQIKLACSDHGASYMPESTYDEATNTWSSANAGGSWPFGTHAYGHMACRPDTGDLYSRYNGGGVTTEPCHRKLASGGGWTTFTTTGSTTYTQIGVGACWWPGSNSGVTSLSGTGAGGCYLIAEIALGSLMIYDPVANDWEALSTTATSPVDPYHTLAVYSQPYNCVVYGGGNGNQRVWRLDQNRTITELTSCPVSIGIQGSNLQCDPTSGKYVLWGGGSNARQLYELDPSGSGTWTNMTGTRAPPSAGVNGVSDPSGGSGGPDALVSCPLPEHGVIAYMSASGASYANMFLYKHS